MNKLISVLALTVIVLPMSVVILMRGPDNLFSASTTFFQKLIEQAIRFGTS